MLENPLLIPCLLGALISLQLLMLVVLLRLSARVSRLFHLIASPLPPATRELADRREANAADQKKWFDIFLAEDLARSQLPKKEQFAAFRRWREEKGMNWKNPADSA